MINQFMRNSFTIKGSEKKKKIALENLNNIIH